MHQFHTPRFKFMIWAIMAAAVAISIAGIVVARRAHAPDPLTFEDCVLRGYSLLDSFPSKCTTPAGQEFVNPNPAPAPQDMGNTAEKANKVFVSNIKPGDTVASPLTVEGEARGTWYFEASFPIELLDANGNRLVMVPAQATDEWMTEDFVPFRVTLEFPAQPAGSIGTLILHKDNPSGLPEHDDNLHFPVKF